MAWGQGIWACCMAESCLSCTWALVLLLLGGSCSASPQQNVVPQQSAHATRVWSLSSIAGRWQSPGELHADGKLQVQPSVCQPCTQHMWQRCAAPDQQGPNQQSILLQASTGACQVKVAPGVAVANRGVRPDHGLLRPIALVIPQRCPVASSTGCVSIQAAHAGTAFYLIPHCMEAWGA